MLAHLKNYKKIPDICANQGEHPLKQHLHCPCGDAYHRLEHHPLQRADHLLYNSPGDDQAYAVVDNGDGHTYAVVVNGDDHAYGVVDNGDGHDADCDLDLTKSGGNHPLQGETPQLESTLSVFLVSFFLSVFSRAIT